MFFDNDIEWCGLTESDQKKKLYANDFYFEYSYRIARQILGNDISQILNNFTLVFVKPEAFITRQLNILVDSLKAHGLEPIYIAAKNMSSADISELWKYSWSAASMIRIVVNQTYYSKFPSGIIVLHSSGLPYGYKNACSYFSDIKGHTADGAYKPTQLRYQMNAVNTFLNHVHSSDDNADFMRELAIFCDWRNLFTVYKRMANNIIIDFNELYSQAKTYPFFAENANPEAVLDNYIASVQTKIRNASHLAANSGLVTIRDTLVQIRKGNIKFTDSLLEQMEQNNLWSWGWESFIMLTQYMEYYNGKIPLL